MRFEFHDDGAVVGAVQWEGPGQVAFDVTDPSERRTMQHFFSQEATYLATPFEEDGEAFQIRRRDWTPWEFERACAALASDRGYGLRRTPSGPVEARGRTG